MKFLPVNISKILVVIAMVLIGGAAFYGLANGAIIQNRTKDIAGIGSCNGACLDCGEIDAVATPVPITLRDKSGTPAWNATTGQSGCDACEDGDGDCGNAQ